MKLLLPSLLTASILFSAGCGRPPSSGGPPGDYSVNAVVALVQTQTVRETVNVVGSLRARDAIDLVSEISAPVKEILFKEGEDVTTGQILVLLDDAKVNARVAEAEARFKLADTNRKRSEELLASATISEQEYDQVQAEFGVAESVLNLLKQELADTVIKAPFDGVAGARLVSAGQFMQPGQPITRLVKMDPLEVEFRVPERAAASIRPGLGISMAAAATEAGQIQGEVFFVDPVVDANYRTVLVKASVPNPDRVLKPGMYGNLDVIVSLRENALVIPESAVRYRGDQAYVVAVNAETKAEFRNVTVGVRQPGQLEIVDGLAAGDRIVVEGFQKMGPGTGIIISPSSAAYGVNPPAAP